ncbi:MAG: hypothetical protein NXH97_06020 [Rhodobacteraceae bacterium]|nr:hypothetical protein [Paracoccaceae bacterium]
MSDPETTLLTLSPSPIRRRLAVGVLGGTGALLIWLALTAPQSAPVWQLLLVAFGAGAIWAALKLWKATVHHLVLTTEELRTSDGTVLCRLDAVVGIDRGAFAFKPSNGFVLKLERPSGPRGWAPGLWWRTGSRIGIGGVTPAAQGKVMAELIAHTMAERES